MRQSQEQQFERLIQQIKLSQLDPIGYKQLIRKKIRRFHKEKIRSISAEDRLHRLQLLKTDNLQQYCLHLVDSLNSENQSYQTLLSSVLQALQINPIQFNNQDQELQGQQGDIAQPKVDLSTACVILDQKKRVLQRNGEALLLQMSKLIPCIAPQQIEFLLQIIPKYSSDYVNLNLEFTQQQYQGHLINIQSGVLLARISQFSAVVQRLKFQFMMENGLVDRLLNNFEDLEEDHQIQDFGEEREYSDEQNYWVDQQINEFD